MIKQLLNQELTKYALISGIALILDTTVFSILLRTLGFDWYIAISLSFFVGVTITYLLSIFWIFDTRNLRRDPKLEFILFLVIGLFGLLLTQGLLWIGIHTTNIAPEIIRVSAAGITFLFNFIVRKILLFKKIPHGVNK